MVLICSNICIFSYTFQKTVTSVKMSIYTFLGRVVGLKTDAHSPCLPPELPERRGQQLLSLQVPQRSHSSASSSEENSSSSAALPLLAGERETPSPSTEEHVYPMNGKSPAEWVKCTMTEKICAAIFNKICNIFSSETDIDLWIKRVQKHRIH